MTRIRWSTEAVDEFQAIVNHIRLNNPKAALDAAQAIFDRVKELATSFTAYITAEPRKIPPAGRSTTYCRK